MNKKLLGVLGVAALLLAGNFAWQEVKEVDAAGETKTVYFSAPSWWSKDSAGSSCHYWGGTAAGTSWPGKIMTKVEDPNHASLWCIELSESAATNLMFVRTNSTGGTDWGAKTADLKWSDMGENNFYDLSNASEAWGTGVIGTWKVYNPEPETWEKAADVISKYINDGYYVRETEIFIDKQAVAEDLLVNHDGAKYANLFHAGSEYLNRTTYFEGDQLWMTNDEGVNSGYGTDGTTMTHFTYENGVKKQDYKVEGVGGMEGYYTTLKDIVPTASHSWSVENNVYTSTNDEVINWFKAFTAPCYTSFEDAPNYITFDYVTISESNDELYLRLYAKKVDETKLTTNDLLFSEAKITKRKVQVAGSFNGWGEAPIMNNTDIGYNSKIELTTNSNELKLIINGQWHGNEGTYSNEHLGTSWDFWGDNNSNCTLTVDAGTYYFNVQIGDTYPKLTITIA